MLDDAPSAVLARPGAHSWQAAAEDAPAAAPHVPEGHGTQTLLAFAPTAADHVPGGHSEHVSEPCAEENPPAPHGAQAIDALPLTPVAAEPIGQGVQVLAPSEENSPAPHALQTIEPASGAAKPLPQSAQAEASTAPGAPEAVPGGQERHPEEVCPKALLYVPAAHKVQLLCKVAPLPLKKRPTGQGLHADAPGALEK